MDVYFDWRWGIIKNIHILTMEIKLVVVSNKNLIWNPSRIKHYWQLKGKSYSDQAADFNDKKMAKEGYTFICLAVILINFVLKQDKSYYLKKFLKCKCIELEKKVIRYITEDQEISSNDSFIEDF